MPAFQGYPADTLKFLRTLKRKNEREWFNKNKSRYEDGIVTPSLQFIADMGENLGSISPHFLAVPKKSGGSMMRIYRDTRFGKDKSPYKTNIGIHFRHEVGKDVHAPGFYVHVEPKSVFLGVGIWHPEAKVAKVIREAIVEDPAMWKKATRGKAFTSKLTLTGESLKRPPRGFDPEHALIEDLKRKDFMAIAELDEAAIESPAFVKDAVSTFKKAKPMMQFLCNALDLPF
ncbi:MAG: DUF2461 domain-containing protein [Planctomycetaceae bacterium]